VTIRATITDSEALREITPEQLTEYLQAHGWVFRSEGYASKGSKGWDSCAFWMPRAGRTDYHLRMRDALGALAQVEDRSELDIFCELVGKPTYEELEREVTALRQGRAPCDSRCPCD